MQPPPQLDIDGYRWAPKPLLNCFREQAGHPFHVMPGAGEIAPVGEGLMVQRFGFIVAPSENKQISLTDEGFLIALKFGKEMAFAAVQSYSFQSKRDAMTFDCGKKFQNPAVIFLHHT